MEQERQEVYERIPWETLEKPGNDRQWVVMAVAGAVALGALAFTFMRSQPVPAPLATAPVAAAPVVSTVPVAPASPLPTTPTAPIAVTEADLFAVDPGSLKDAVAAHAEWFAVEYFSYDGSDQSALTLGSMLPQGVPLPEAPPAVQVFVDWVGVTEVVEVAPVTFEVSLVVRSLVARDDGPFVRQAPRSAIVEIRIGGDGSPVVGLPPVLAKANPGAPQPLNLSGVPEEIRLQVEASHGQVVGGEQMIDGRWKVVVLVEGSDGVVRPATVIVP
ncbi:MAG: hypothetical protein U9N56_10820 [Actinomycetota bacterium]|nr:hypothetical protein [Actinomycetota bacterium]